jgi:hypothetical protein
MPPLALLKPTPWSPATKLGMATFRGYLVLAAILLVVKAVQVRHQLNSRGAWWYPGSPSFRRLW